MAYGPCKNPSCKSYGKPHPNCRCYGGMAKGGEVEHFCSKDRAHKKGCQYFDDGGQAEPSPEAAPSPELAPSPVPEPSPLAQAEPNPSADSKPLMFDDIPESESDSQPLMFDDIPETEETAEKPLMFDDIPDEENPPRERAIAGLEGAAKGQISVLAPYAENLMSAIGVPDVSPEDQKRRLNKNPLLEGSAEAASLAAGMYYGVGEALVAGKLAAKAAETAKLGKIGSSYLSGAISTGIIQGGDEWSKALLGQGDPEASIAAKIAHSGVNILLAMGAGGLIRGLGTGAQEAKAGEKLTSYLTGIGVAAQQLTPELAAIAKASAKPGSETFYNLGNSFGRKLIYPTTVGGLGGAINGWHEDGVKGAFKQGAIGGVAGWLGAKVGKYAGAALLRTLASPTENIAIAAKDALNFSSEVGTGANAITKAVASAYKGLSLGLINNRDVIRKKVEDFFDDGGLHPAFDAELQGTEPQGFADGGEVKAKPSEGLKNPLGEAHSVFPEQNMALAAAAGRMSQHLNSLRPQKDMPRLPFDEPDDQVAQKKAYHKAIDIAGSPLSVMDHIANGTLDSDHIRHFKTMFPELDKVLQQKMTEKILKTQLDGGPKPPLHVRSAMSAFMGIPLGAEMKPANISASQHALQLTRAASQEEQKPAPKAKNSKAPLSKVSQGMQTTGQSLVARQQRQS